MTTKQFIERCVTGKQTKTSSCSSVYFDGQHVYSYGTHYPLLVHIGDKWILNQKRYSQSTSKHISWASTYANLFMEFSSTSPLEIYNNTEALIIALCNDLANLRKGATRKQESLAHRLNNAKHLTAYLKTIIK